MPSPTTTWPFILLRVKDGTKIEETRWGLFDYKKDYFEDFLWFWLHSFNSTDSIEIVPHWFLKIKQFSRGFNIFCVGVATQLRTLDISDVWKIKSVELSARMKKILLDNRINWTMILSIYVVEFLRGWFRFRSQKGTLFSLKKFHRFCMFGLPGLPNQYLSTQKIRAKINQQNPSKFFHSTFSLLYSCILCCCLNQNI